MIRNQYSLDISDELIVDNFAGGGGASTGIELALGRCVDVAVNHDAEAVAMHEANHPQTLHLCESVFDVDPLAVTRGRPVGLAWFSPDCTHFSKARGTKPRKKSIRGLAWVILRWAALVRPRVIMLENVEEFLSWGPLGEDLQPDPVHRGRTFATFKAALTTGIKPDNPDIPEILEVLGPDFPIERCYDRNGGLGYDFDHQEERACNHGAPTIRKRLFGIGRCDGRPIVWPAPTHGDPKAPGFRKSGLKPWRTAAECIDWNLPCPSIFERTRPLAEATCRRIAKGIMRYVINCADPFILRTAHGESSPGGVKRWGKGSHQVSDPLPTVTGSNDYALVAPVLTEHANASRPNCNAANAPLRTQCAQVKGGHFALVSAFLAKHYGGHETPGWPLQKPASTVTAVDHHGLVAAHLTKFRTGSTGSDCADPIPTITAGPKENPAGAPHALGLVSAHVSKLRGTSTAQPSPEPLHTISAGGNHFAEVRAFLVKYYGNEQEAHEMRSPVGTVTTRDRFGLVMIQGQEYAITDIGLRMLAPRELFKAQGFPDNYIIGDRPEQGLTLTKSAQVRMCGNSVCPPLAAALVGANVPELAAWQAGEKRPALISA